VIYWDISEYYAKLHLEPGPSHLPAQRYGSEQVNLGRGTGGFEYAEDCCPTVPLQRMLDWALKLIMLFATLVAAARLGWGGGEPIFGSSQGTRAPSSWRPPRIPSLSPLPSGHQLARRPQRFRSKPCWASRLRVSAWPAASRGARQHGAVKRTAATPRSRSICPVSNVVEVISERMRS
jgi:hypothetical protein